MNRFFSVFALSMAVAWICGCGATSVPEGSLHAGGSTFGAPLMNTWAVAFQSERKIRIAYDVVGSGKGISGTIDKTLDFGLTDAPLTEQQLLEARNQGGEIVHIPLALGAVVPAYHLQDLDHAVNFTGPLLADIFLGKITKWNDPRLQAVQEPDVKLPHKEIVVVHRSDGSGTTYVFSEYLSKVSPVWREQLSFSTDLKWPAGVGCVGNQGVTDHVMKTVGAIGYIELVYVYGNDVQWGAVQNREGSFIQANSARVLASAEAALGQIPDDLRYSLVDPPGKESYPICGTTWAVVYAKPPRHPKAITTFLQWAVHEGQKQAKEEGYAPLPRGLRERAEKQIAKIAVP